MHIVRRLYLPLLIVLCALWSFIPIEGGDDFWAHAAIGRIFLETGHVPKSTVYLWSADVPWVFHAYGSGIIYAFLLRLGGPWLALCLNFALGVAPLLLVWRHAKKRAGEVPLILVCAFVPALWFSAVRWRLRPEGFTVLFLTITLLFLLNEKRARWQYFAIAAMFALWPNLHGGVLGGIMVLGLGAIAETAQRLLSRATSPDAGEAPKRPDYWLLGLAVVCAILPLLCNPWGLGYSIVFGGTAATSNHISEWRHFWVYPALSWYIAWGVCALCAVSFVVWCLDKQKRASIGAALLLLTALWIQARRQMWLTSTTCMVTLAQSAAILSADRIYAGIVNALGFLKDRQTYVRVTAEAVQIDTPMRIIAQLGVLIIIICACIVNLPVQGFHALGKTMPIGMSRFLLTAGPTGRVFNDYEYSAALEWYLEGKRPLYIDLINAYPPKIFDDWFEVAHANKKGLKMLDDWKVDVVALRPVSDSNKNDPIYNLVKYLDTAPKWKLIYKGDDGRVWQRRKLYNAPVLFNSGYGVRPQQLPRP